MRTTLLIAALAVLSVGCNRDPASRDTKHGYIYASFKGPFKNSGLIENTYDKFKNFSVIKYHHPLTVGPDVSSKPEIEIQIMFTGPTPKPPFVSELSVYSIERFSGRFHGDADLNCFIDGSRKEIGRMSHTGGGEGDFVAETMQMDADNEILLSLANAKTAECQIENFEFKLGPDDFDLLRDLVSRVQTAPAK